MLQGARCIVTGGTRGLGRAIALALARHGARVAITYSRSDADAEETVTLLSKHTDSPLLFKGCVSDPAHAKAVIKAAVSAWDGLDVLINNAGITQVLPIALLEESDWDRVMAVNVKGPFLFSRAALRPMIRARSGKILNIGNFASERLIEAPVHYAASKSALRGLTESLAREVGRYGIAVNMLSPGLMNCGMSRVLPQHRIREYLRQNPSGRLAEVAEIAEMAAWMVSPGNRLMTGAKVVADGGL